ncbi:MAG: EF-P lysine aminoacylase EpmA [Bdellovibrionales bacterium]
MNWWQPHNFAQKRDNLEKRAQIIKQVRIFFENHNFTETQTPALQIMPSPDTHIHAFQTIQLGRNLRPKATLGLHTSPEIAMKKLLVAGMERIYQICPVFRNAEEGTLHSPEFIMLEWYRSDTNYIAMMDDCEALIKSLGLFEDRTFERLTVTDAFKAIGVDIDSDLKPQAETIGVRTTETDTFEDIFHAIMAEKIEPNLGHGTPTFLIDYPIPLAALAKRRGDIAERFELYINGIEIANAFSELTDPVEQRKRLEADLKAKKDIYDIDATLDEDFITALEHGMPSASGCALGLERLVMIACDADNISDVQWTEQP